MRLAHRGDWRRATENSIEALVLASMVPGCDGVEFDVRASVDGVPILLHDETLERVQHVSARADEMPADELESLGVPRLVDVLAALPQPAFLDVELKEDLADRVVDMLAAARGPRLANAVVSSFWPAVIRGIRQLMPEWPTWLNTKDCSEETIETARSLGCRGVSVEWHAIDARAVTAATNAGLEIAGWTVTRRPTYRRLERLGLRALCVERQALTG